MKKEIWPKKCISVRLKIFRRITDKCYIAVAYDGTEDYIPASEFFGPDTETTKSRGYWIAEWILKRKILQRKTKNPKIAWFGQDRKRCPAPETKPQQENPRKPRRTPRRTRFHVTYENKRTGEEFKCVVVELNEETAKTNLMTKFFSGKLEFSPIENGLKNEIKIKSIETRPGRNKPEATTAE